jgi:hypothetical protein
VGTQNYNFGAAQADILLDDGGVATEFKRL